jgi:DNA-binding beta-propeller fold protein YncE
VVPSLGGLVYVATAAGTVVAISLLSHGIVGTLLNVPGAALGTMDYDAVTGQVYVPDATHNVVHILSPGGGVTRTIPLAGAPVAVAITFEGSFGFIAERTSGRVVMLDATDRHLLATLAVDGTPEAIVTGAYPPGSPAQPPIWLVGGLIVALATLVAGIVTFLWRRRGRHANAV